MDGTLFHLGVDWKALKTELVDLGANGTTLNEMVDSLIAKKQQRALQMIKLRELAGVQSGRPVEDAGVVLNELMRNGVKIAIVSRNFRDTIKSALDKIGVSTIEIIGREDTVRAKPDQEGLLLALKKLEVGREDACMVGDTYHDIEMAKSVGVESIVLRNPHLRSVPSGAGKYLNKLKELTALA